MTDASILEPMTIKKNSISVQWRPTSRFQNFLRIENWTIISRDTVTFVQHCYFFNQTVENILLFFTRTIYYILFKHGKKLFSLHFYLFFDQPPAPQRPQKIFHPWDQQGMVLRYIYMYTYIRLSVYIWQGKDESNP